MPYLPWVSTHYYKRKERDSLVELVVHAMLQSSFEMGLPMPASAPNLKWGDCPYRRPWNNDKTWISLIEAHQFRPCTDIWITCSIDQGGLGADLHTWTAFLASAMEMGNPIITEASLGKPGAQYESAGFGALYEFGNSAGCHINNDDGGIGCFFDDRTRCDSGYTMKRNSMIDLEQTKLPPDFYGSISDWRREAVTFLFMHVRPWLLDHACDERARVQFEAPDITVQIRWGDKWKEMRLFEMQHYIDKVNYVVTHFSYPPDVKIFVMTEDRRALDEFRALADARWKVQVYEPALFPLGTNWTADSPRHVGVMGHDVATSSLVAMHMCLEATHYIGASGSNWARLMNELRQSRNMYSAACKGCTHFHDLSQTPVEW